MTISLYLWGVRIITFFAFLVLVTIIFKIDPESSGWAGVVLFYVILFLTLAGTFILFLTWLRRKISHEKNDLSYLGISFRQGILLSILIVGLLILQSFRWLVWWDGLLFLAGIFLIELYFLSRN